MRRHAWRHTSQCILVSIVALWGCGPDGTTDTTYTTEADDAEEGAEYTGADNADSRSTAGQALAGAFSGFDPFERQPCQVIDPDGPTGTFKPKVEVVAKGLEAPWELAFLPNGDILVTERPGRLRLIRNGRLQFLPVLRLRVPKFNAPLGSEGGMLGILLHPNFATNRLFYLYHTTSKLNGTPINRLSRYKLSLAGTSATLDKVILDNIPSGPHHQGGRMRIGPDGKLYLGVGAYDAEYAQQPDELPGKLLRMNLDGSIPEDNPNPESLAFLTGVRNTQGYDWYDADHLFVMDHGPTGIDAAMPGVWGLDEFNVVRPGDNLGWPDIRGCDTRTGFVTPIMSWRNAMPPSGAAIYRGTAIPEWRNSLLVTSLGFSTTQGRHLHRIQYDPNNPYVVQRHEVFLRNEYGRLRSAIMGPDGHLYLTTSNCEPRGICPTGKDLVLRIVGKS